MTTPNFVRRAYWETYERRLTSRPLQIQVRQYVMDSIDGRLGALSASTSEQIGQSLYAHGIRGTAARWSELPIMTRADLEASTRCRGPRRDEKLVRTGGSTGEPAGLFISREGFESKRSRLLASRKLIGWHPGMPMFGVWGSDADLGAKESLRSRFQEQASGIFIDGGFVGSDARWRRLADRLCRASEPVALYGYSSLLADFAQWLSQNNRDVPCIATVWNGAEAADDRTRNLLRTATGQELHDFYGARESGALAVEVIRDFGLIPLGPHVLLEVVDANGQLVEEGQIGRVLVSILTKTGTPLLRYEIGDLATAGPRFEFGHSRLLKLEGRSNDVVPLTDGGSLRGPFFSHMVKDFPSIREFQVLVNVEHATAQMRVVKKGDGEDLTRLLEILSRKLTGYTVSLEEVPELERTKHGKLRQVIVQ
jgi:phenylacetate-CoA ligase